MPPPGAGANNYILFVHSLHSTLQAPTCLYEAMSSQCTPYPGAPFLLYLHSLMCILYIVCTIILHFKLGWTGSSCSTPDCSQVNRCSGNGICVGPAKCSCIYGYTGNDCNQQIDCPNLQNCNERGVCIATLVSDNATEGYQHACRYTSKINILSFFFKKITICQLFLFCCSSFYKCVPLFCISNCR